MNAGIEYQRYYHILALNYTLWVKIGQKWDSQIWAYILQKGLLIQNWLFRLGRVAVDPYLVQKENEGSDKSCLITDIWCLSSLESKPFGILAASEIVKRVS